VPFRNSSGMAPTTGTGLPTGAAADRAGVGAYMIPTKTVMAKTSADPETQKDFRMFMPPSLLAVAVTSRQPKPSLANQTPAVDGQRNARAIPAGQDHGGRRLPGINVRTTLGPLRPES
jgi:hypothetical protein